MHTIYNNDITVELENSTVIIKYPEVTLPYWKSLLPYYSDNDLCIILDNILVSLDCSITFSNMRVISTVNMNYELYISRYYYYLLHIENQYIYNEYFDKLCKQHNDNIVFETNNPIIEYIPKIKTKTSSKNSFPNKFVRQVTTDMFTNKETYIYTNLKTKEIIKSDNPNLIDDKGKLIKEKKEKKVKSIGVPISSMMFVFKKKE